jgi:hypothetical protein
MSPLAFQDRDNQIALSVHLSPHRTRMSSYTMRIELDEFVPGFE